MASTARTSIEEENALHPRNALAGGTLATVFLAGCISLADARWFHQYHRGPGPVLGLVGAAVVGSATVATVSLGILAGAGGSAPPPAYYGPPPGAYAAPPSPPPNYYYYRRAPGYYYGPPGYYGY
jgi:hypothetical protein